MKNSNRFPRSLSFPSENFWIRRNKNDNKIEKNKRISNSFNKSKDLNDNKYFSIHLSNLNKITKKEHINQSELDNFNIEFFLPNNLPKNMEEINDENNSNKEHFNNITELTNQKDINFNNNYFMNNTDTKNEKEKNISKNQSNFLMNLEESYEDKIINSYQKINNLSINNKESFYVPSNMTTPPQNINDINSISNNNKEMLNNEIDLNVVKFNNCSFNINNINLNNIHFTLPKYNHNLLQFHNNNNNMYFLPQKLKTIYGNNFSNYQYLNETNFINSTNQFNSFVNHQSTLNNGNPCSNYNNDQTKNYTKKIIDDYTLEMFGRRGWICQYCNNFNYETRKKCNRCHIIKVAKKVTKGQDLFSKGNNSINHKCDWVCKFCGNFNYSFRTVCNRCQIKKYI